MSDKYQVDFVKEKCRQFLTESTNKETPFEELMKTIQLADRFHLKDLVAHCTKHAKSKKPSEMLKRKADDLEGMLLRRAVKRLETELDKSEYPLKPFTKTYFRSFFSETTRPKAYIFSM